MINIYAELCDDQNQTRHKEDADSDIVTVTKGESPCIKPGDETAEDNSSLPCSSDSNYSVSALLPTASSSTAGQIIMYFEHIPVN